MLEVRALSKEAVLKVLIAYGTKEGQTRKIARYVADRLCAAGNSVELLAMTDAGGLDLSRFDRVILASPIHAGHYQRALTEFVVDTKEVLSGKPNLFLSVSLSAEGHDAEDWRGLDKVLQEFQEATGWNPERVEQIAGAYKPSEYDIVTRFIMRRIIAEKDPAADPAEDNEYTDWANLDRVLEVWLKNR